MAEYHVGCGAFGIYAGRLNKKGDMWVDKSEVTDEVLSSAFDYLYGNKKELISEVDGKEYVMRIVPYEEWIQFRVDKGSNGQRDFLIDYIEQLPPVTPKARWISCNERLPKAGEYVGDVCKYYLVQDEYGDMHVAHLSKVGWIPMDSLKAIGNEIIAWQELPQPYVESGDIMSKETTCENCIYSIDCIMYEPKMKRCKDYKESEEQDADSN